MDGRFEVRREELLAQAQVSAEDWDGVTERLEAFVNPFVGGLTAALRRRRGSASIGGAGRSPRPRGPRSTCAMVSQDRSSSTSPSAASQPAHRPAAPGRSRCCSSPANVHRMGHSTTTTTSRTPPPTRPPSSSLVRPSRNTASKNASNAARARRASATTKSATGSGGITIKHGPSSPRGSSTRRRGGEKIPTPAMTVPQARRLIASQIEHQLPSHTPAHIVANAQRRLQRNELARAARYEARNMLTPFKNQLRT